eukprot:782342-Amphidinium_carterae.2
MIKCGHCTEYRLALQVPIVGQPCETKTSEAKKFLETSAGLRLHISSLLRFQALWGLAVLGAVRCSGSTSIVKAVSPLPVFGLGSNLPTLCVYPGVTRPCHCTRDLYLNLADYYGHDELAT